MISDRKLTENFTLYEFLRSDIAERNPSIKKKQFSPNSDVLRNLQLTAELLQKVRDLCNKEIDSNIVIHITSGYRCPDLNKLVNGSKTSDHMYGRAADFKLYTTKSGKYEEMDGATYKKLVELLYHNKDIKFYQLIKEFGTRSKPVWIHLSQRYLLNQNDRQFLEIGSHTNNKYKILDLEKWT